MYTNAVHKIKLYSTMSVEYCWICVLIMYMCVLLLSSLTIPYSVDACFLASRAALSYSHSYLLCRNVNEFIEAQKNLFAVAELNLSVDCRQQATLTCEPSERWRGSLLARKLIYCGPRLSGMEGECESELIPLYHRPQCHLSPAMVDHTARNCQTVSEMKLLAVELLCAFLM